MAWSLLDRLREEEEERQQGQAVKAAASIFRGLARSSFGRDTSQPTAGSLVPQGLAYEADRMRMPAFRPLSWLRQTTQNAQASQLRRFVDELQPRGVEAQAFGFRGAQPTGQAVARRFGPY